MFRGQRVAREILVVKVPLDNFLFRLLKYNIIAMFNFKYIFTL